MSTPKFSSLEDYLDSLDQTKRKTMGSIIEVILAHFPELEVKISWNVPQIQRSGKYIVGLSAAKNHLSYSPWSTEILENFEGKLEDYVVKKNLFQIPIDWDIDSNLLIELVQARLNELDKT